VTRKPRHVVTSGIIKWGDNCFYERLMCQRCKVEQQNEGSEIEKMKEAEQSFYQNHAKCKKK